MADNQLSNSISSGSGGGSATSSGILFEQRLGALFAANIISGARLDPRLGLGDASPVWLRFETEAPVDDLLVATTNSGFVAIQAKTTASLSVESSSPFSKTIDQFVRHWFTCRGGDGTLGWNRPLDSSIDRLVLAVGPQTSAALRIDLPTALRLLVQPGGGRLTQAQTRASEIFKATVKSAWAKVTSEPFNSELITDLARLIIVWTVDLDGSEAVASSAILSHALPFGSDGRTALALLGEVSGVMMARRGGGDAEVFRRELATRGVQLAAPPRYRGDIEALRRHSIMVAESLQRYEAIEAQVGVPISIERDCQAAVLAAAQAGPLLIVGEPGAGKSGVLNALARALRTQGHDVLELAVDRYSVESLEGLSRELELEHGILEVLDAWDGPGPGWLIIDALDATRGGRGEGVFRNLIERVIERSGRWQIIASIRTFDLRMGRQLRQLFKGTPPVAQFADSAFVNVRHIEVRRWSDSELSRVLVLAPALSSALEHAPARLRDLGKVPFNTRLLSELIADGILDGTLANVSSQVELLKLFWQHRIDVHGLPARACLKRIIESMINGRTLRASPLTDGADPSMIDTLSHEGVLIRVEGDRWVQFRHHLLFDFAVAQVFLEPSALVSGELRFPKREARGLMLSPAMGFVMREIWDSETDRARFWLAIGHLLADAEGDPIIRSAASRFGAEHPKEANDTLWLAGRVAADDNLAMTTLNHVSGALAVRIEDNAEVALVPWTKLASALAPHAAKVSGTLRFLLHLLTERVHDEESREDIGRAARAMLAYGLSLTDPGVTVRSAIGFVADTYQTSPEESRSLLRQLFIPERLLSFGVEEVPALCYKVASIGELDPGFIVEVFVHVYAFEVSEDRETRLGDSQILPLRSNARQDYDMARFSLSEYFAKFLELHPASAIDALIGAVDGYVERQHSMRDRSCIQLSVEGVSIRLREDQSHIWAHDPDSSYSSDGEVLVVKLLGHLRTSSEADLLILARMLCRKISLAILWSRLFIAASERGGRVVDELWSVAAQESFIMLADTRKDAIDVIGEGARRRSQAERVAFETAALKFDFSDFTYPTEARKEILGRVFTAIGYENLCSEEARTELANFPFDAKAENERLFVIRSFSREHETYSWITDLDRHASGNASLIVALDKAKITLNWEDGNPGSLPLNDVYLVLDDLNRHLLSLDIHPSLRVAAEEILARGCASILKFKLLQPYRGLVDASDPVHHFVDLLRYVARSISPVINADTESSFERSVSWSSPAPRVEAAQILFDLLLQRPDLYESLKPDIATSLADFHPAVRLQAAVRLVRLWEVDREGFWRTLAERLTVETNLAIIAHLAGDVLGRALYEDPPRAFWIINNLLTHEDNPIRAARIRANTCGQISILWVRYGFEAAHDILLEWLSRSLEFTDELRGMISTLNSAVIKGLSGSDGNDELIRFRAISLFESVVKVANAELIAFHSRTESSESQVSDARKSVRLIDFACQQFSFAINSKRTSSSENVELGAAELYRFLQETASLIEALSDYATPHTTYNLLQLLDKLAPINPGQVFDLAAHALRAGTRSGYQHESMGMDLLVKMIGVFLADYKEIFELEERRAKLVDSLEIFMEAGWPAARRLLYRLPELIQ